MARQGFVSLFSFSCGTLEGYQCQGQKAKEASKGAGRCVYTPTKEAQIYLVFCIYLTLLCLFPILD